MHGNCNRFSGLGLVVHIQTGLGSKAKYGRKLNLFRPS
jgi:hypothetical protein